MPMETGWGEQTSVLRMEMWKVLMLFANTVRSSLRHTAKPDLILQDLASSAPLRTRDNCLFIRFRVSSTCTRYPCPSLRPGLRGRDSIRPLLITCCRTLAIDESGDYVDWLIRDGIAQKCELGTLFGLRRKTLYHDKALDILRDKKRLPTQPQPVSMGPATLLGQVYAFVGSQSTTGAQIDALRKYLALGLSTVRLC